MFCPSIDIPCWVLNLKQGGNAISIYQFALFFNFSFCTISIKYWSGSVTVLAANIT